MEPACYTEPDASAVPCEIPFHDPTSCSPQFADGHVSMLFELGHTAASMATCAAMRRRLEAA
jgi:hypothetical protein